MNLKGFIWMMLLAKKSLFATGADVWKEVLVDRRFIEGNLFTYDPDYAASPPIVNETSQAIDLVCAMTCERRYWCNSWCLIPQNGNCLHTDVRISPLHVTNSTDPYKCYTNQEEDFIAGATVTQSFNPFSVTPTMVPQNLILGIYNHIGPMTCGNVYSGYAIPDWVLFKLKTPQNISTIRIDTQPSEIDIHSLQNAKVSVSTFPSPDVGNFGSYQLVGSFPSTPTCLTTYSFSFAAVTVQYVVIEKNYYQEGMTLCRVMAL